MSEYNHFIDKSGNLCHARQVTFDKKPTFKYYAKVPISPKKNRYFYTKEEYQAYLNSKKTVQPTAVSTQKSATKTVALGRSTLSNILEKSFPSETSSSENPESTKDSPSSDSVFSQLAQKGKEAVNKIANTFKTTLVNTLKNATSTAKKVSSWLLNAFNKKQEKQEQEKADQKAIIEDLLTTPEEDRVIGLDIKTEPCSKDEDMAKTNPNYGDGTNFSYNSNCISCVLAYDLRQRGYNVEAVPTEELNERYLFYLTSAYQGASWQTNSYGKGSVTDIDRPDDPEYSASNVSKQFESDMIKFGNGARGVLSLNWKNGGGHVAIWEVEDGKVIVRDVQANYITTIYDMVQYCTSASYYRLDDATVKPSYFLDRPFVTNSNKNKEDK